MNKHFSLWSTLVLITCGIEHSHSTQTWRIMNSLKLFLGPRTKPWTETPESLRFGDQQAPVSGRHHHHHDPREVCVEVATVPPKSRKIFNISTPSSLEPRQIERKENSVKSTMPTNAVDADERQNFVKSKPTRGLCRSKLSRGQVQIRVLVPWLANTVWEATPAKQKENFVKPTNAHEKSRRSGDNH